MNILDIDRSMKVPFNSILPKIPYALAYRTHYGKGISMPLLCATRVIMPASIFTLEFLMAALVGRNHTA